MESMPSGSLGQDEAVEACLDPVAENLFGKPRISMVRVHGHRSDVPLGKLHCGMNHFIPLVLLSVHGTYLEETC